MDLLPVILVGFIGLVSILWQRRLFKGDRYDWETYSRGAYLYFDNKLILYLLNGGFRSIPTRLQATLIISSVILIGVAFYAIFLIFDTQITNYTIASAIRDIIPALIFGALLILKSYFGPLVQGYLAGYSVYMYFQYNELIIPPIIEWLLGLVLTNIPPWMDMAYTIGLFVYLVIMSIVDLDFDF